MNQIERTVLQHRLVHLLWDLAIEDVQDRGIPYVPHRLREHRSSNMPTLPQLIARQQAPS